MVYRQCCELLAMAPKETALLRHRANLGSSFVAKQGSIACTELLLSIPCSSMDNRARSSCVNYSHNMWHGRRGSACSFLFSKHPSWRNYKSTRSDNTNQSKVPWYFSFSPCTSSTLPVVLNTNSMSKGKSSLIHKSIRFEAGGAHT